MDRSMWWWWWCWWWLLPGCHLFISISRKRKKEMKIHLGHYTHTHTHWSLKWKKKSWPFFCRENNKEKWKWNKNQRKIFLNYTITNILTNNITKSQQIETSNTHKKHIKKYIQTFMMINDWSMIRKDAVDVDVICSKKLNSKKWWKFLYFLFSVDKKKPKMNLSLTETQHNTNSPNAL